MDGSSSSSYFWLAHQRTAHGQHLLLAAGERTGGLVAALLQTRQQVKDHVEVILDGLLAVAACVRAHLQVLLHGQAAEHAAALRHLRQAQADDLVRLHLADGLAAVVDLAALQLQQTGDRVHRRGLARAVRTDQGDDLALIDMERNVLDGVDRAIVNIDIFVQKASRPSSVTSQICRNDLRVVADGFAVAAGNHTAIVQHGDLLADAHDKAHIMLNQ